ncbi:hypothetical protein GCM10025883_40660 [Mobilicoccus caccae]|uniref:UDP-N-acetylglucosamine 2-epimerase (non-hydrolyzing) n=1 Tax=Mobilicoccus caccae TaxID=1859295 RepID=A0ABQ6IX60_9MICO|nr:hypothetical protein GCM10025883_40660 [Mobilicoccus caccae]
MRSRRCVSEAAGLPATEKATHIVSTRPLVLFVYGTRPEAIKMAPLVLECRDRDVFDVQVVVTGQHREMLTQVNDVFGIVPEHDLELFEPGQGIESIVAKTLTRLTPILADLRPAAVVVHGDTSTANAAAQAAFYAQVPVVHLEAGLRTGDLASPFPEEANRQLIGRLADLHLAPTAGNRAALLAENVDPRRIVVTGNTVIDALHRVVDGLPALGAPTRRRSTAPRQRVAGSSSPCTAERISGNAWRASPARSPPSPARTPTSTSSCRCTSTRPCVPPSSLGSGTCPTSTCAIRSTT